MGRFDSLKRFFGIEKFSKYTNEYFDHSNILSSLYVASLVVILEFWMICSTLFFQFVGDLNRSTQWLFIHIGSYIVLLISALVLLIYSILHLKKIVKNRFVWWTIRFLFSIVALGFGIYISYLDYLKGEQFITLMTMTILVFCFTVWRPIFSVLYLTISYGLFFFICNSQNPTTYATNVNLTIVLIVILLSAINSYRQKLREAKKEEKLEHAHNILLKLAISDEVTGIANMNYFRGQALDIIHNKDVDVTKYLFLFFDIENFKILNRKYGFLEGNNYLRKFADILNEEFKDAVIAHFSNDNFVVFCEDKQIKDKIMNICQKMQISEYDLKLKLKVGSYRPKDKECLPLIACDHARFACYSIKKNYNLVYCEYTKEMAQLYYKKQYILNNFDKALENNYIKVYYQPVIHSDSGKICGLEALARWDDPDFGFLSPVDFITTLEEYHQIHRLDMFIVDTVCKDLIKVKEEGRRMLPISLNFSRLDFDILNLPEEVEACISQYNIPKEYFHIEITESTLSDDDEKLMLALDRFRKYGYSLWLDDFGSGYSALNVLKEYKFDMMKIDMKFLQNFSGNKNAETVLKHIINLAKDLGMQTLTEGVETQEAYQFLKENGCDQLQGYLFGKPMPKAELDEKFDTGFYQLD